MSASTAANPYLNENGKESVWKYPRPPDLQKTSRHLRVVYGDGDNEIVLADTKNAYRVLETRCATVCREKDICEHYSLLATSLQPSSYVLFAI